MPDLPVENSKEQFERVAGLTGEKLGKMAAEFSGATNDSVKDNPIKVVAIAAAVGILAGSLLTLALRKRD